MDYFKRMKAYDFKVPLMIGFGISDYQSFKNACEYANGIIIGSAFIQSIANSNHIKQSVHDFVTSIKWGK